MIPVLSLPQSAALLAVVVTEVLLFRGGGQFRSLARALRLRGMAVLLHLALLAIYLPQHPILLVQVLLVNLLLLAGHAGTDLVGAKFTAFLIRAATTIVVTTMWLIHIPAVAMPVGAAHVLAAAGVAEVHVIVAVNVAAVLILTTYGGTLVVRQVLDHVGLMQTAEAGQGSRAGAGLAETAAAAAAVSEPLQESSELSMGRMIGNLERLLVVFLGAAGQWSAVAIVIAVKALARFEGLKHRPFAEYYLVGTLCSLLVAFAVIWLVQGLLF